MHAQDQRRHRERKRSESKETYDKKRAQDQNKYRSRQIDQIDALERIRRFNLKVLFGPIFICSCCHRKLFENGVSQMNEDFEEEIDAKNGIGFYRTCIYKEIPVNISFEGNTSKSGNFLCHTCKSVMQKGKLPSMSVNNGLKLVHIEEKLTELENNLIALNINFQ